MPTSSVSATSKPLTAPSKPLSASLGKPTVVPSSMSSSRPAGQTTNTTSAPAPPRPRLGSVPVNSTAATSVASNQVRSIGKLTAGSTTSQQQTSTTSRPKPLQPLALRVQHHLHPQQLQVLVLRQVQWVVLAS